MATETQQVTVLSSTIHEWRTVPSKRRSCVIFCIAISSIAVAVAIIPTAIILTKKTSTTTMTPPMTTEIDIGGTTTTTEVSTITSETTSVPIVMSTATIASVTTSTVSYPLIGVTVAGYGNGSLGSASNAAVYPWGLVIGSGDLFYVSHYGSYKVMKMKLGNLTGSIVAGTGAQGADVTRLFNPAEIAVDSAANVYVVDTTRCRVMLWRNNSTFGIPVVGNGTCGSTTSLIGASVGLAVDSQENIYVADYENHRVMRWAPNATSGIVIAGTTGVAGSTNQLLNRPYGLYLDENNSYIYIGDLHNHRIQRYRLGDATNGTTVAGGNGAGNGIDQLNGPYDVCVSKKTGDIYIADVNNHRIERWTRGATSGTTIVGITGISGANATTLNAPANVALSPDEAFLYVSDMNNHRVQRYQLF